jgi:hypothetical protein
LVSAAIAPICSFKEARTEYEHRVFGPWRPRVTEMQQLLGIYPLAALLFLKNALNGDNR